MTLADRARRALGLTAGRAGVALAAPRPTPPADLAIGAESGEYGGPTSLSTYTLNLANELRTLLSRSELNAPVVHAMRRHYQVSACLSVQRLPIVRADWSIECDDDDVREVVTIAYRRIARHLHRSAARSLWAGYSPNVLVWDVDPATGALVPTHVRDLDPFTCRPLVDSSGSYAGLVQHLNRGDAEVRVDPLASLWLTEDLESGNLYGRSLLEAAREPWADWQTFRLYHARYLERFGEPVVKNRAPSGVEWVNEVETLAAVAAGLEPPAPEYRSKLHAAQALGEGLRHHSVITLPSSRSMSVDGKDVGYDYDVEFLEPSRSGGGDFREALKDANLGIARGIFVPDLLIANTEGTGSNALGQEHQDVWTMNVEGRLDDYSHQIGEHLLRRIVEFNFGDRAPAAHLVFAPQSDDDAEQRWQLALALAARGALNPDVQALASSLGVPLTVTEDDDDEVSSAAASPFTQVGLPALIAAGVIDPTEARALIGLTGTAPGPPAPVVAEVVARLNAGEVATALERDVVRGALGLDRPRLELAAPPGQVGSMPEWKQPQALDAPAWVRAPNARERRTDFARVEDVMNGAERDAIEVLATLLDTSRERVIRQLEGIMRAGGTAADVITKLGTLDPGTAAAYASAWSTLMRTVWVEGLDSVGRELDETGLPDKPGALGNALIRTYASASAGRAISELATRLQLETVSAARSGVSKAGLVAVVSDLFDKETRSEAAPPRLTTRMLASRALNEGRADAIERGGIRLAGAQYSALLDRRTCDLCRKLDEQVIAIGHTDYARFTPPVHHNCRCVWVYIRADEDGFTPTWSSPSTTDVDRFGSLVV